MITVGNITAKSTASGLGKLCLGPADSLSPWGPVLTLLGEAVRQVKMEMAVSGRTDLDGPDRKYLDGPTERLLTSYADRLYVLPFYCASTVPNEIRKELSRERPLDPVKPGSRRHCTKLPTFGLWYLLPGKLRETTQATEAQHTLLRNLHTLLLSQSIPNRTPSVVFETAKSAAASVLAATTALAGIVLPGAVETAERNALKAFLEHMTKHFKALQAVCERALDPQNPESAITCLNSMMWANQIMNWEKRTPRKEKIL